MRNRLLLTSAQLDYLRELTNIGAGHAAGTLSALLRRPVNSGVPQVRICPTTEIAAVLGAPDERHIGVRTGLSGDVTGIAYFVVPSAAKVRIVELVRVHHVTTLDDTTLLRMTAQTVTTSYLTAVQDFCGLNIKQSPAAVTIEVTQALVHEVALAAGHEIDVLAVQSDFTIMGGQLDTALLILADPASILTMAGSVAEATRRMTGAVN